MSVEVVRVINRIRATGGSDWIVLAAPEDEERVYVGVQQGAAGICMGARLTPKDAKEFGSLLVDMALELGA